MSSPEIPLLVKDFVFQYIDSVEQLDILLLLCSDQNKLWTADELSAFLRSSRNSIEKRMTSLENLKLVSRDGDDYRYTPETESLNQTIKELGEIYKVHRYRILEIIFSPMKKGRDFADAFKITGPKEPKGGTNG